MGTIEIVQEIGRLKQRVKPNGEPVYMTLNENHPVAERLYARACDWFVADAAIVLVVKENVKTNSDGEEIAGEHKISHFDRAAARLWGISFGQINKKVIGQSPNVLLKKQYHARHPKHIDSSRKTAINLEDKSKKDFALKDMNASGKKRTALALDTWDDTEKSAYLKFESFTDGHDIVSMVVAYDSSVKDADQKLNKSFVDFVVSVTEPENLEKFSQGITKRSPLITKIALQIMALVGGVTAVVGGGAILTNRPKAPEPVPQQAAPAPKPSAATEPDGECQVYVLDTKTGVPFCDK